MKRIIGSLTLAMCTSAFAAGVVGPVSQYGQLITGKNSSGKGQIYGSCEGVKDGKEVQVRGMSLYWSLQPQAVEYWSADGVSTMVKDMKIQIVRAAMATGTEDWKGSFQGHDLKGYQSDPEYQKNLMNTVVQAAIDNDIYVIIDWHSHVAHTQTASAKQFFSEMAQKWGKYDNVIFELFNEPQDIPWSDIKTYANEITAEIRKYSDNLILVGTRKWDQNPDEAIGSEVTGGNIAYTMHYYANSHCYEGSHSTFRDHNGNTWNEDCEGTKTVRAMNAGLSVFVSEWGTANSDGAGTPGSNNAGWQTFLNTHKLSWANWSASNISEGTAAFTSGSNKTALQYTTSGSMVKGYLSTNPTSYTKCSTTPSTNQSSDSKSSSSVQQQSSSSSAVSSSSQQPASSSSSVTPASSSSSVAPASSSAQQSGSCEGQCYDKFSGKCVAYYNGITASDGSSYAYDNTCKLTIHYDAGTGFFDGPGIAPSSSSAQGNQNSSSSTTVPGTQNSSSSTAALKDVASANFNVSVHGKLLQISGATANVDVFDMQGRPMMNLRNVSGTASLASLSNGNYIVRIKAGSKSMVKHITLK